LSNAYGTAPIQVGAAHVALRDRESVIGTGRPLTFGGETGTTIPAGAVAISDGVDLKVPNLADLAIDIYLPWDTNTPSPVTTHTGALQTNYVSVTGNHVGVGAFPVKTTATSWFLLGRVEVMAPESTGAVVALGDSITDGSASTRDTNNRWPNHLANRLAAANIKMGVLNVGIGGNRILTDGGSVSAQSRFDRDVAAQPGATHVIFMEGINDINNAAAPPTVSELIAAHRQIIARARALGLKIYGGTLTPYEGANSFRDERELSRQALNQWIRTSKEYDAVIDFDAALRDPNQPNRFLAKFDSGDHLHPNDAGYKAMAEAIDLELFRTGPGPRTSSR
jgi:lysophospholipase L1-like esterase